MVSKSTVLVLVSKNLVLKNLVLVSKLTVLVSKNEYRVLACLLVWGYGGARSLVWQVTPCDPVWQVTLRSSVMGFPLRAILGFNLFKV